MVDLEGLYGCNMVFRAEAIGQERFDEQLPLYAWQEDIDFTARVGRARRMVKTDAFQGVHQGVKGARLPGTRRPGTRTHQGSLPRLGASDQRSPVWRSTNG